MQALNMANALQAAASGLMRFMSVPR
jgi:hypothetical protein